MKNNSDSVPRRFTQPSSQADLRDMLAKCGLTKNDWHTHWTKEVMEIIEDAQKPQFRPPLLQLIVYSRFCSILLYIYSYFYVIFFLLRHKCILYWKTKTTGRIYWTSREKQTNKVQSFLWGGGSVNDYGLPDQVRSDLGGENTDVWLYMIEQKQSESAVLVGSSTHNQRIERLSWW